MTRIAGIGKQRSAKGQSLKRLPKIGAVRFAAPAKNVSDRYPVLVRSRTSTKGSRKNNFTFLCADASRLAVLPKVSNISIFLTFGALLDGRLNT